MEASTGRGRYGGGHCGRRFFCGGSPSAAPTASTGQMTAQVEVRSPGAAQNTSFTHSSRSTGSAA